MGSFKKMQVYIVLRNTCSFVLILESTEFYASDCHSSAVWKIDQYKCQFPSNNEFNFALNYI
jgi:hypothetical protein